MITLIIFLIVIVTCDGLAAKYPSNFPKCPYGDTDCIKNAIQHILPLAQNGLPALNIAPLNPITIDKVELIQGGNRAVTLETTLTNVKMFGIETFDVRKVIGFGKDIAQSKFEIHGYMDHMSIVSDYKMNGRILVLPIAGNGILNWTISGITFSIKWQPMELVKNDKKYLRVNELFIKMQLSNATVYLTNLFGGDEKLGRTMNQFLNVNWREIYDETKEAIEGAIGKILIGILNNIFSEIEYKELFINE